MLSSWSDTIAPPKPKVVRQFAGLWLIFFTAAATWRAWHGDWGSGTEGLGAVGILIGALGIAAPQSVRWLYTACMIVTFPIGLIVSHIVLAGIFYLVVTPVALTFRLVGRDELRVRRRTALSYWSERPGAEKSEDYLRQS